MRRNLNMSKELVVKDNSLIEANYNLTKMQQKLLIKAISLIEPESKQQIYKFSISDFASQVDLQKSKTVYSQMHAICNQLANAKSFKIERENGNVAFINWVASAEYIPREAVVEIEFSQKLMPLLFDLKKKFTKYYIANVMSLNSSYSMRMFEILKQYEGMGKRIIDLEDLRRMVGTTVENQDGTITKEYEMYGHFKSRVILPAQKELKAKTDIYFEFKEIRQGHSVSQIEFTILPNTKNIRKIHSLPSYDQLTIDIVAMQQEFEKKTGVAIKYDILEKLVQEKGIDKVKKYIDNWHKFKHQTINNILGFFIVAVTNDFDIPTKQKASSSNFEQRHYTEEELQHLYNNFVGK